MNRIVSHSEFILDLLLEAKSLATFKLVLSPRLRTVLRAMQHPIAAALMLMEKEKKGTKVTYIDIDDKDPSKTDLVSFIVSTKAIEAAEKAFGLSRGEYHKDMQDSSVIDTIDFFHLPGRSTTSIGRVVKKILGDSFKPSGDPGNDIESFVNEYKALRDTSRFELVSGEDIRYWYFADRYIEGQGPLNGSCMRYESTQDCLDLYVDNPDEVSMLILRDSKHPDKIRGRAIVWTLSRPVGMTFMDRIYYVSGYEKDMFIQYAKDHKWMYKQRQTYDEDVPVVDTISGEVISNPCLEVSLSSTPRDGGLPYMDTMKYLNTNMDTLASRKDCFIDLSIWRLEDTNCSYEDMCEKWSDFYDDCVDEDDMIWCGIGDDYRYDYDCYYSEYYSSYVADDYADEHMVELDIYDNYNDRFRFKDDTIETYEGNVAATEYAEKNLMWSKGYGCYLEDAVFSERMDDLIPDSESVYCNTCEDYILEDDAVTVCIDEDCTETDHMPRDEKDSMWYIADDGNAYAEDVEME